VNVQNQEPWMKMVPETDLFNAIIVVEKVIFPENAQNHKRKETLIVELLLVIIVEKKDMSLLNVTSQDNNNKQDLLLATTAMVKDILPENVLNLKKKE